MTTVQEVLNAAEQLSPVDQLEIIEALSRALQRQYNRSGALTPLERRIPSLDAGPVWISDDFDAELPDAFWLGSDHESPA